MTKERLKAILLEKMEGYSIHDIGEETILEAMEAAVNEALGGKCEPEVVVENKTPIRDWVDYQKASCEKTTYLHSLLFNALYLNVYKTEYYYNGIKEYEYIEDVDIFKLRNVGKKAESLFYELMKDNT